MSLLSQLVYISEPTIDVKESLTQFIPVAQKKNEEFEITGLLITSENFYLQVIEGKRSCINDLYRNIIKDPRHKNCTLLRYLETKSRDFPNWSMAYVTLDDLEGNYLDIIVPLHKINCHLMTGVTAMSLLRRVSAYLYYSENSDNPEA